MFQQLTVAPDQGRVSTPLFEMGRLYATPASLAALETSHVDVLSLLARHVRCACDADAADRQANRLAARFGGRVLSVFHLSDTSKLYVDTGADRKATVVMLAEEY